MSTQFPEDPLDPTDPRIIGQGAGARWYDPIKRNFISRIEAEQRLEELSRQRVRDLQEEIQLQQKLEAVNKRVNQLFTSQRKELENQLKQLNLINKQNEIMFAGNRGRPETVNFADFSKILKKAGGDPASLNEQERRILEGVQQQLAQDLNLGSGGGGRNTAAGLGTGAALGALLSAGRPGEEGMFSKLLGHAGAHKLGIPFIGPLVSMFIRGAFKPTNLPFAALTGFELGAHEYRQLLQSGRVTGEGAGAGLSAALHSVALGLNPFDLISMQTALAIENGVRAQGFKDKFANAMADTVGEVVNRLGIDYKQAIDLLTTSVRQGNESLTTFRASMQDVAQISKDSSIGVANLVQSIKDLQDFTVQTGGPSGVQFAPAAVTAFARTFGNVAGLGAVGGKLLTEAAPMLAPMMGVPSILAGTRRGIQATGLALDSLLPEILAMKPANLSLNDWAAIQKNAGVLGQLFPSATVTQIERLMSHYSKPGAVHLFGAMQRRQAAQARESAQTAASLARKRVTPPLAFGHGYHGMVTTTSAQRTVVGERAFINTLRQRLQEAGLNADQINRIIAPLQGDIGNSAAFNKATQALTGPNGAIMRIGLTPEARRIFRVEGLQNEINKYNYYLGRGPSQSH